MTDHRSHYLKNLLLPCVTFSFAAGVSSAIFITLFQWVAKKAVHLSDRIYSFLRESPSRILLLVLGATALALVSAFILYHSRTCRGGGIPTSIAAIRGITNFRWFASLFILPISAMLTYLCGIPLGTEGPCVQMGTAIGDGVVRLFGGKKSDGWRRYIMTGGASAGFSIATGAPISAILFSMEELHKRFSPLLFSVASLSVIFSQITARLLAYLGFGSIGLFDIGMLGSLPLNLLFIPAVLGALCGGISALFTRLYHHINKIMHAALGGLSLSLKFPIIFVCVALIGYFIPKVMGSGHSLIEGLIKGSSVWYLLIIVLLIRAILMMVSNTSGITGGIFLPTLAFGAIIGALCAEAFIALGLIGKEHYVLLVVLGMTAFLGSTSRIPITACVFAIEAFSGIQNVLPIIVAVSVAFVIVEISGLDDFTDTVIEATAHAIHEGKKPILIKVPLTVFKNSFVIDKELNDILWPASCVVLSTDRPPENVGKVGIAEGDILTVHYKTYDPIATAEEFEVLVGDQPEDIDRIMRPSL